MDIAERALQLKSDIDSVYDAGKKSENDRFWEEFQQGGERKDYNNAFRNWGSEYLRPKYKVKVANRLYYQYMFCQCQNLKKVESEYFSFSLPSNVSQTDHAYGHRSLFESCVKLEEVEDLGLRAAIYYRTWRDCSSLRKISVVRSLKETVYTTPFTGCTSLTDITFEGEIGQSLNMADCPLSKDSFKNLAEHLFDYTGTEEYTYTLTVNGAAFEVLESEGATAEYDGVACTWAELIDNKKWNLVKV